jgi:hypothetical protein
MREKSFEEQKRPGCSLKLYNYDGNSHHLMQIKKKLQKTRVP